jgi:hypothetical protein
VTQQEATRIAVAMAQSIAEDTGEGQALRILLRELKEYRRADVELGNSMVQMQELLETAVGE